MTAQGVIKHQRAPRLPISESDVIPVNAAAGGYFTSPALVGSEQFTIVSMWLRDPGPNGIVVNSGSVAGWRDQFAEAFGVYSQLSNFQANFNSQSPTLGDEEHWIWIWDTSLAVNLRSKWYRNGVQILRDGQLGAMNGSRNMALTLGFLADPPGTTPFAAQGVAEYWFHAGQQWTDGDETKFIVDGAPADLGADGSTPYGVQPLVYLGGSMEVADWNAGVNLGSLPLTKLGGDFTEYTP